MSPPRNIVILGGSYGGLSTAHYILQHVMPRLKNTTCHRVVLVSASRQAMCRPACPRAMLSDDFFDQDKLFIDIPHCFRRYPPSSFEFIHGSATDISFETQTVQYSSGNATASALSYYALIIATGASTLSPLLGINTDTHDLRAAWTAFRDSLSYAKCIVIVGGGPAGVETAAELAEHATKNSFSAGIVLVTAASALLPVLRPIIAARAEAYLQELGITVIKETRVLKVERSVEHDGPTELWLSNGKYLQADVCIPATGTQPNTNFIDPTLLEATGRIMVDEHLKIQGMGPRLYAIGDASSFARPAIHNIMAAVPVLCNNLAQDLLFETVNHYISFKEDKRETQMVLLGRSGAVGAAMGWRLPGFLVRWIKRDYWLWSTPRLWSGDQWAKG